MKDDYYDFFERVGDAVTIKVALGSIFGYYYEMKKSSLDSMANMGLSVSVGAGYDGAAAKVSGIKFKKKKIYIYNYN